MDAVKLFVLSARPLEQELQVETGARLPIELAIGPDLLLNKNLAALREAVPKANIDVTVIVPKMSLVEQNLFRDYLNARRYIRPDNNLAFRMVCVNKEEPSFFDTFQIIRNLLMKPAVQPCPLIIIPGDVLFQEGHFRLMLECEPTKRAQTLLLSIEHDQILTDRWTIVRASDGKVIDRQEHHTYQPIHDMLFSGMSMFWTPKDFVSMFAPARISKSANFFEKLISKSVQEMSTDPVFDFGHLDSYWHSRFAHLSARTFNRISFDDESLMLSKTSTSTTFQEQAVWYDTPAWKTAKAFDGSTDRKPVPVRVYLPHTETVRWDKVTGTTLEIEALPYHPVSELIFNERFTPAHQTSFIRRAVRALLTMYDATKRMNSKSGVICRSMYKVKTEERLEKLFSIDERFGEHLFEFGPMTGKGAITSLALARNHIGGYVHEFLDGGEDLSYPMSIIHGDFCLSNLLFDMRTSSLKMIDPRGLFGEGEHAQGYGDLAYDIAKLKHSLVGGYDLVLAGVKFSEIRGDIVRRPIRSQDKGASDRLAHMAKLLDDELNKAVFDGRIHVDVVTRSNAIMPLLFLSMLPLHAENFNRVLSLASIGINAFHERFR